MSRIRSADTKPELVLRSLLHRAGYRFRLHVKTLPGKPDIVLPKYKVVIFVHGCFWHRHEGCKRATIPKSRVGYWLNKFEANILNFQKAEEKLHELEWRTLVIWECELKKPSAVLHKAEAFLKNRNEDLSVKNEGAK